jgi:Zn finger protein HypA/HybF involved in hydrogenase expression
MTESILCDKCLNVFDWDSKDWFESEEEEEIEEIECPKCKTKLSVSYTKEVNFRTHIKE